jgi:hypothetical protein
MQRSRAPDPFPDRRAQGICNGFPSPPRRDCLWDIHGLFNLYIMQFDGDTNLEN